MGLLMPYSDLCSNVDSDLLVCLINNPYSAPPMYSSITRFNPNPAIVQFSLGKKTLQPGEQIMGTG